MGYVGDKFTWFRGGLKERLDRAVTNAEWMGMHLYAGLCNLEMGKSDHRPILLDTEYLSGVVENRPKFKRQFEARWLEEETVEEVVRTAWQKAVQRGLHPSVKGKIDSVHRDLHDWDRKTLKGPRARLNKAQKDLEALMQAPYTEEGRAKQKELSVLIENLLDQEEIFWAQRGRVRCLRKGDRKT